MTAAATDQDRARDRRWSAAQAAVALVACLVVVYACARHGPAICNDTAAFFSAADSVVAGEGLITPTRRLFILWPPLPPLLLAFLAFFGIEYVNASLLVNLAGLFLTLWFGARLVTRLSDSPALGLLWCTLVALVPDMLWIHTRALSEPLFVGLCTVAVAGACAYLQEGRPRHFAMMTIGAGLAWVERYAGIVLLPVIGGALLFAPGSQRALARLGRSAAFGLLAALPMVPWVVRNLIQTGEFTGGRGVFGKFGMSAAVVLEKTTSTILDWFTPHFSGPGTMGLALAALIVTIVGCLLSAPGRRRWPAVTYLPLIGFPLAYVVFTGVINANFEIDGVGRRQIFPALPAIWALALLAAHRALDGWRTMPRIVSAPAILVLVAMLGVYFAKTVPDIAARTARLRSEGTGTYSTDWWHESKVLAGMRELAVDAELYSNDPYALYYFIGRRSHVMPAKPGRYGPFAARVRANGVPIVVCWFLTNDRAVMPVDRMEQHLVVTPLVEENDGTIWRLDPR